MSKINGLTIVLIIFIALLLVALVMLFQSGPPQRAGLQDINYSQLLTMRNTIRDVTIRGNELTGHTVENKRFMARIPADPAIATRLADAGIAVAIGEPPEASNWVTTLLVNGVPLLLSLLWLWPLYRIARALERGVDLKTRVGQTGL